MYNITIDQNADVVLNVPAAGSTAGQKIMVKFFDTGINIFNIATPELGGLSDEIVFNADTDYEFTVTKEQALKAVPTNTITYELYLISAYGVSPTLVESGSVTVTALIGAEVFETIPWVNSDRKQTLSANYNIKADSDTIYAAPPNVIEVVLTLPDANTMPGKRFEIKNIGQGTVRINTPHGDQLINLDLTGDSVHIKAKGNDENDWECFYG